MKFKTTATTAAIAAALLSAGLSAASAQTITFTQGTMAGADYVYDYTVSGSPFVLFSFADANTYPDGNTETQQVPANGSFLYTGLAGTNKFSFESLDAPSAGAVTVTASGGVSESLTGPKAATVSPTPEPSAMVSMSILGACLGLGILAKRRKSMAS